MRKPCRRSRQIEMDLHLWTAVELPLWTGDWSISVKPLYLVVMIWSTTLWSCWNFHLFVLGLGICSLFIITKPCRDCWKKAPPDFLKSGFYIHISFNLNIMIDDIFYGNKFADVAFFVHSRTTLMQFLWPITILLLWNFTTLIQISEF
jgi:hypothetical protein